MKFIILIILCLSFNVFSQELIHIVKPNDNLMKISYKYYKTRKCWRELLIRNGFLKSDKDITVGDKIIIVSPHKCFRSKINKFSILIPKDQYYYEDPILKGNKASKSNQEKKYKTEEKNLLPSTENIHVAKEMVDSPNLSTISKIKYYKATLSFAPFLIKRNDNEQDITYGGSFSFIKENKELFFEYERNIYSSTDVLTRLSIKSGSQNAFMTFDLNYFLGNFTYFALASYDNEREGDIFITQDRFQVGPMGLKYYFIRNNQFIKDLSLSFIPLFEYLVENVPDDPTSLLNETYHKVISKQIRQSLRLRFKMKLFNQKLKLKNTTFYRPAYLLDLSKFDFNDALFKNSLKLSYNLADVIELSYKNIITWDERAKTIHLLPSTDMVHQLSLDFYKRF